MNLLYKAMKIISKESKFFYNIIEEYKRTTNFNSSRIRQDLTVEDSTSKDYRGRELYELLQNAEDEKSDSVVITLKKADRVISIENSGEECTPFTEDGFCSIMMTNMSPKRASERTYIGQKGLGFRSLLNWADKIIICSSGVRCSFSYSIAGKYWKSIADILGDNLKKEHEEFAANQFGRSCPIPMLSVPEVEDDTTCRQYTTKIEIVFNEASYDSIKEQLDSLSGKVLLFLSHIKSIIINEDGEESREIKREDNFSGKIKTFDSKHKDGQIWRLFEKKGDIGQNKKYEIKIAYDILTQESGNYVYSFFPTRVRLDLPCVVHATFDLNSSRNDLITPSKENDAIQKEIGYLLLESAEELAQETKQCDWQFYKMVNMKNEYDQERFCIVNSIIKSGREGKKIFPTIEGSYRSYYDTSHYSEGLAAFLSDNHNKYPNILGNHLLLGYSDMGIVSNNYDDILGESINEISNQIQSDSLDVRASLIASLVSVNKCSPMNILIDDYGEIIVGEAFINVGESLPNLPVELNIKYVQTELVEKLIIALNVTESNKGRAIRSRLSSNKCAEVSDLDINSVKKKISSYTQRNMNSKVFEQLMFSLFSKFYLSGEKSANNSLEGIFHENEFKVLNKLGESVSPSMVVLNLDSSYCDKWALHKDIHGWKTCFEQNYGKEIDEELIVDFFIKKVGVSEHIPLCNVEIDCSADDYIWNATSCQNNTKQTYFYRTGHIEYHAGGQYNHYFIPDVNFLASLDGLDSSLYNILSLILSEPRAKRSLFQEEIFYFYKGLKEDYPKYSYSSYLLRQIKSFEPIRDYIISDKIFLGAEEEIEKDLNRIASDDLMCKALLCLGAHQKLSELSVEELYDSLRQLTEREKKPSAKVYKAIKDAVISKDNFQDKDCVKDFYLNGKVFARKGDGEIEIQPVNNVYYWDNDQLPQLILKSKYKLLLPNREGEDKVKKVFGVKLAKEISMNIGSHIQNSFLSECVQKLIINRRRLLLAYRLFNSRDISDDKFKKEIAKDLRNITVRVYTSCECIYDGKPMAMKEGDMVTTTENDKQVFHICSSIPDLDCALREPSFCANLAEAICISLKVSGHEMFNGFRNVIKNTDEENKYYSSREIPEEIWNDVDKALGISEYEKNFWHEAERSNNISINNENLSLDWQLKKKYLTSIFPDIILPTEQKDISDYSILEKYLLLRSLHLKDARIIGKEGLYGYYKNWFMHQVDQCKNSFAEQIFLSFDISKKSPYDFRILQDRFEEGSWLENKIREIMFGIYSEEQLLEIFEFQVLKEFGQISLDRNSQWCPVVLPQYQDILNRYMCQEGTIEQKDLALTYFPGYEREFEEIIKKKVNNVEIMSKSVSSEIIDVPEISIVFGINKTTDSTNDTEDEHSYKERKHGGSYTSEAAKIISGKKAEKIVFESLSRQSDKFVKVKPCSRNLDSLHGNDKLHYDIKYTALNTDGSEGEERFLEVKSMTSNSIILSKGEKLFAEKNAEKYDIALVIEGKPYLLLAPFVSNGIRPKLIPVPETFSVTLEIQHSVDGSSES